MARSGVPSRLGLPEEDPYLAPVEEYEVLGLVGNIGAEAAPHDAVPCRVVHGVELGLEDVCDVIQDSLLLERIVRTVNCMLLHLFRHVSELDDCVLGLSLIACDDGCLSLHLYHYSNYKLLYFNDFMC